MEVKNLILGAIIAVIFVMFCAYGTNLAYKSPKYENFCNTTSMYRSDIPQKIMPQNCTNWQAMEVVRSNCYNQNGFPISEYDSNGCEKSITCSTCNQDFQKADEIYSKNLFIISIVIGVIVIIISFLMLQVPAVAGGLMLGSLFYILYGTARYWGFMNDWLRFIILGVALVVLIGIAYYAARRNIKRK